MLLNLSWLRTGSGWTVSWPDAGADYYRVVLWGEELARVVGTSYRWDGQGVPPPLEVVPAGDLALSEVYSPRPPIQWYAGDAESWTVQELLGSWRPVATLRPGGLWFTGYRTPRLVDGSSHSYRVFALNGYGNASPAETYSVLVVCPPEPPDGTITVSYDEGSGSVVVEA